uniref:Cyanobacterial aminoacyl-tRNA synthetase CAAD domain-containing protein n=1 Tax=Mantoniella antarctica TaxID=81844 RepID=A0A7S0ST19_9CHLO|eukprot:CAMPEP_0181362778 /NCGR_PEP_ID=MMETSP1106-20121128/8260_1 /TAXON_ID=81844 /ORGANISM="Mantoniella antarctica, Strain SL-175" /LENGTH=157 /DNA_ID=CAMNT_0023476899 /DNA_START=58 /DNA_END=531 /DNA_ORIENTATION=+
MATVCNVAVRATGAGPKVSARGTSKVQTRAFLGRTAPLKAARAAVFSVKGSQGVSVRADAATDDLNKKLKEVTETVSEKWGETEDKPAVITLAVYGIVGLIAANGVLKSIDGLPLVPDLLELVGIGFSGFYVYQNLLFKPDRAALKESISKQVDKIL